MSTALPAQMRAMLTVAHGGREQLFLRDDYPVPAPGQDELLLRVTATAVNFHDIFTRRGMPGITLPLPVVVGSDFAGEVIARGSAVETPAVGDRVLVLGAAGAAHRVNYREEPFKDAVRRIYGKPRVDGGVTVAINFTGGDTLPDTQRCVAKGVRILCCGATAGFDLALDARYWWTYEHRLIGSNGWSRQDLVDLLTMIAGGQLDPLIDSALPLEQAPAAEARLEEWRVLGKLLLRP